jgi:hypothetical protein
LYYLPALGDDRFNDEEKLIMKTKMTRCNACNIPKYLEASVTISVLMKYDQQKISRDKAMEGVVLKEME